MSTKLHFETASLNEVTERCAKTAPKATEQTQERGATQKRRVLVVDDEHVIADTLASILNQSGFAASAAYDAASALDTMTANLPDLLITDVSMPGMSGVDLAIATRDRWPGCKILLFSGHAATGNLIETAQKRGYDFELLTKPVHPRDLLQRLMSA